MSLQEFFQAVVAGQVPPATPLPDYLQTEFAAVPGGKIALNRALFDAHYAPLKAKEEATWEELESMAWQPPLGSVRPLVEWGLTFARETHAPFDLLMYLSPADFGETLRARPDLVYAPVVSAMRACHAGAV